MAQSAAQMKRNTETPKAPKVPKTPPTEAEARAAFGKNATTILSSLERSAKKAERIMRKNRASEAQLESFRKGIATLTDRITRAAKGESVPGGFTVPTE